MMLLYVLVLVLLVAVKFLTARRAAALERKYARVAGTAEKLVRQPVYRAGNGGGLMDPYQVAKRQFQLGQLIQTRDRLEGKYVAWQRLADQLGNAVEAVRGWKGRKLPYTFGVLDVAMVFGLIDYLGAGEYLGVRSLVRMLTALWAN